MREIKFRFWFPKTKEMYFNDLESLVADTFNFPLDDDHIIMQYTGLKDKNRKEIYEGDICKYYPPSDLYVVAWVNDLAGFKLVDPKAEKYLGEFMYDSDVFEVIGNIYENPEKIEGEK